MTALLIVGMHRSGTSLLASWLQQVGLNIGENLLPGQDRSNPRGFFEDTAFLDFHEAALHARGLSEFVTAPFTFEPTAGELDAARALLAARQARPLWGWKDPRTCLFLAFWHGLLPPDTRYLLVYRHPLEVWVSLVRRGNFDQSARLDIGLDMWRVYNEALLSFYQQHPERCLLAHSYRLLDDVAAFRTGLSHKLGLTLPLNQTNLAQVYHPADLHRLAPAPEAEAMLNGVAPGLLALYRQLQGQADLPWQAEAAPRPQSARPQLAPLAESTEPVLLLYATAPAVFAAFWAHHRAAVADLTSRAAEVESLRQQVAHYEHRLQSQDLMTRHYLHLTWTHLQTLFQQPALIRRKMRRWLAHRFGRDETP